MRPKADAPEVVVTDAPVDANATAAADGSLTEVNGTALDDGTGEDDTVEAGLKLGSKQFMVFNSIMATLMMIFIFVS
jgi:hypothetical protein